jgi:hypothetical protein
LARLGVRGTFSQPGPSRPAAAVRLARTLGVTNPPSASIQPMMKKKRPIAKTQAPPPQPPAPAAAKTWRERLLLGQGHAALWGALGVLVAFATLIAGYFIPWNIQSRVEASNTAKITYAVTITPNPPPGEDSATTNYWGNTILIWNAGPATAKTVILHLHMPSPDVFLHSPPQLVSAPPAASVKINERSPAGIYEVVLQNFTPGEFCGIRLAYRAEGELADAVRKSWKSDGMFSPKFAKYFIKQFWFSGEGLAVENTGALDVAQTFPAK